MTVHRIWFGGEPSATAAYGTNAWAMFPMRDIDPVKEYKPAVRDAAGAGGQSRRIHPYDEALRSYFKNFPLAVGDTLEVSIIPRHYQLEDVTTQVYNKPKGAYPMYSVLEDGEALPDAGATGMTGSFTLSLESPAYGAIPAASVALGTIDLAVRTYAAAAVPAVNQVSTLNRKLVLTVVTVPADATMMNFEVTAIGREVRDMGR